MSVVVKMAKRRGTLGFKGTNKIYKHKELMSFQHVRSIVNFIQDKCELCYVLLCDETNLPISMSTAGADLFGFLVHHSEDVQEKLLVFQLASTEKTVTKENLLTELCSLIAELNNSSNTVSVLMAH